MNRISSVMKQVYQKEITMYNAAFLGMAVKKRMQHLGASNYQEYCVCLAEDSSEAEAFFDSLHITYSQFFRDSMTFALLEQHVLPNIFAQKPDGGEIRVWSAGCSSGQEAYSVAMLLSDLSLNSGRDIRYRIFATDICPSSIAVGQKGVYDQCSIQDVKEKHIQRYFERRDNSYTVKSQIRRNVNFSLYDLLDEFTSHPPESIFGDFDIVLCCNLLIYYTAELQQTIIQKLKRAVSKDGYLITGEAERLLVENSSRLKTLSVTPAVFMNHTRS